MRKIRVLFILLFEIFYVQINYAQNINVSGTIASNTTWSADTVKVTGNILIPDTVTLSINPGTKVIFQGWYLIDVRGVMLAVGTPADSIIFAVSDTTGLYDPNVSTGKWKGFFFDNSWSGANGWMNDNDTSKFEYCKIRYVNTIDPTVNPWEVKKGAISVSTFNKLIINNTQISYCYSPEGGGICLDNHSDIKINNSEISYNHSNTGNDFGGGMICRLSNPVIVNSYFHNNYSARGGAIYLSSSSPVIVQSVFCNNYGAWGGAVGSENGSMPKLTNCVLAYNKGSGGGIAAIGSSSGKLYNCIISGNINDSNNPDQVFNFSTMGSVNLYNCLVSGGIAGFTGSTFGGEYINCIDVDPQFIAVPPGEGFYFDCSGADWKVQPTSPCINKGNNNAPNLNKISSDYFNNNRLKFGYIDLGIFEFSNNVIDVTTDIDVNTQWMADTVKIWNSININSGILTIYPGTIIQFQDHYNMMVYGAIVAEGTNSDSIVFTVKDTTGFSDFNINNGGWGGVRYYNLMYPESTDSSKFKYCRFEYGKNVGNSWDDYGILLLGYQDRIKVDHCFFTKNHTNYGSALILLDNSPEITNCVFENNFGWNTIVAQYANVSKFINNKIINNNASGIYISEAFMKIKNCLFANNQNYGIMVYTSLGAEVLNTTITNNAGPGISIESTDVTIKNSIIWGNQITISANYSTLTLNNNNFQGGAGSIFGSGSTINNAVMMDADPTFRMPASGTGYLGDLYEIDWSLLDYSPCINKGISNVNLLGLLNYDINGNNRVNTDTLDLGAYENQGSQLVISAYPDNQTVCAGTSMAFTVSNNGDAIYQWYKNGTVLSAANSSSLQINNVEQNDEGAYSCRVSNAYGSFLTPAALLIVKTPPNVIFEPVDQQLCENENLLLSFSFEGSSAIGFSWQKDNINISGATQQIFAIQNSQTNNSGIYRCILSNACGSDTTREIAVTVHSLPEVHLGNDTNICANTGFVLDAGSGFTSYLWNNYQTSPVNSITSSGNYYVRVEDVFGCVNYSDTIHVQLATPDTNRNICLVTFDTLSDFNKILINDPLTSIINSYNIYKKSSNSPYYEVIGNVPYGAVDFVDIYSEPSVKAEKYRISILDTCGNETFLSSIHQTIHLAVSNISGSYNLVWNNYTGFVFSSYKIYRGTTIENMSEVATIANGSPTTWTDNTPPACVVFYQIIIDYPSACIGVSKVGSNIVSNNAIAANTPVITGDSVMCQGQNDIVLNAGDGYASYNWTNGGTSQTFSVNQTGTYQVTVTNNFGCLAMGSFHVTVYPQMSVSASNDTSVCLGQQVQLQVSGGTQYIWSPSSGLSSSNVSSPLASPDETTLYSVTVTNNYGCYEVKQINVTVNPVPESIINYSGNTSFCMGDTLVLIGNEDLLSTYQWYKNSSLITGANDFEFNAITTGNYTVKITNEFGCYKISSPVTITVNSLPTSIVTFIGSNSECEGNAVQLLTTIGSGYIYQWYKNTIEIVNANNSSYAAFESGEYSVNIVNGLTNCSAFSPTQTIIINPKPDATISYTGSLALCQGDTLYASVPDVSTNIYQWQRNNINLSGEISPEIQILQNGYYRVSIVDIITGCSTVSNPLIVSLNANPVPQIIQNDILNLCVSDSILLTTTQNYSSYIWSGGSTGSQIWVLAEGIFSVTVTDQNNCQGSVSANVTESVVSAPEICMVLVDSTTNKNIIVWEKEVSDVILYYRIYKESNVSGYYNWIGNVPYSSTSIFPDLNSNPAVHADRYKISAVDTCGNETEQSLHHRTLHLSCSPAFPNGYSLLWADPYEGFDFYTYNLYRVHSDSTVELFASIQNNLTGYTDQNPPADVVSYFVAAVKPGTPCNPTGSKDMTGPFSQSLSNIEDNGIIASSGNLHFENYCTIYPVPAKDDVTVIFDNPQSVPSNLKIMDITGKIVIEENIRSNKYILKAGNLKAGVYFVEIIGNGVFKGKIIIE